MLRPFLLSLVLSSVVPSGGDGADQPNTDKSIWRWSVSTILDAQRGTDPTVGSLTAESFDQRYQRYSVLGLPEGSREAGSR